MDAYFMQSLHAADLAVIGVYLISVTAIGVWTSRRVTDSNEFFLPRRFGALSMMMHAFGTGTASDQAVTVASSTAQRGLSGIWYQWLWLIPTPFYWIMAPILRRLRAVTTSDVFTARFSPSVAVLFAVVGILSMSVKIGVMLKGAGALIEAGTADLIDANLAITLITVLFIAYGMAGGMGAAIMTDLFQGLLTIVFSFILLPFVLYEVGGIQGIRETVAPIDNGGMLSLVAPGKITLFFILMMGLQGLAGIIAQPHVMAGCGAGKTEWEGRVGFMVGNLIKRLCTVAWCVTAIAAVAWYLNQGMAISEIRSEAFADRLYGNVAQEFLPRIMPGLLGVFLAAMLAAVMSSCDSYMIASSGLFTENIYRSLRASQSEFHYLWVGRIAGLLTVAGGVYFAFWVEGVVDALEIWFKISPMTGIALWISLFWRRMTVAGAWATALTGFGTWFLTTQPAFITWVGGLPHADTLRLLWQDAGKSPEIYAPWQILFYMSSAAATGIAVSFFTPRVDGNRLDEFYGLIRTPIQPGEVITAPCTLPDGVAPADRPMLIQRFDLEIPRPSRTSVAGFLAGTLFGIVLVGTFFWMFLP